MSLSVRISNPECYTNKLNLWSMPDFMNAVAKLHKAEAYHLQCYKGEQLIAVLPVYTKKVLGFEAIINPTSSYYQGLNIWLETSTYPQRTLLDCLQITSAIANFLHKRYRKMSFNLSPDTVDIRGFTWEGLRALPFYTYVHDYSAPLKPLYSEHKNINKAIKHGYSFGQETNLEEFIRLLMAMNGRKKRENGVSYTGLATLLDQLIALGYARQYNMYLDGKIVSSEIIYKGYSGTAYTIYRATSLDEMKHGVSSLHTTSIITELANEISELDFCGANIPDVARFKASFGLRLKVYYRISN